MKKSDDNLLVLYKRNNDKIHENIVYNSDVFAQELSKIYAQIVVESKCHTFLNKENTYRLNLSGGIHFDIVLTSSLKKEA